MSCGRRWSVVQTYPQAEPWCASNLRQRGYPNYLAMRAERRRDPVVRSLYRTLLEPLYRGYLFVEIGDNPWVPVRYCPGVLQLIMTGDHPAYVPAGAVERLQAGEAERHVLSQPGAAWAPGAACKLTVGAFADRSAVVKSVADDGETAVVTTMMFGQLRDVTVPVSHLATIT